MKKLVLSILITVFLFNLGYIVKADENPDLYNKIMKQDLFSLMMAYPEYIIGIENKENKNIYLITKSERKLIYDDKNSKTHEQKLSNPDLQDMMDQIYPLTPIKNVLDTNFDPGRCRVYQLLNEVYGSSRQSIESNLRNLNFGYGNLRFNGNNNAANCLQAALKELIPIAERNPNVKNCLFPCSGTFNYRLISGTNQLSPHSFGIAIDLAVNKSDYWKWASKANGDKRLSSYPNELVEVFEKNNFIWGGKWGHFDIMHFEYRPEIIIKARYFGKPTELGKVWYDGLPLEDVSIKNIVDKINETLK